MLLDQAVINRFSDPMWQTWNAIGYDIIESCAVCGEELDNEQAIESCMDANNLMYTGDDKEADDLLHVLCAEHGYRTVLEFFMKHFKYA